MRGWRVKFRREADVADRGLGRLKWAESDCWPNGGKGGNRAHRAARDASPTALNRG